MSERTPLQILQYYADGGHYYSDTAQWAIERITELQAKLDAVKKVADDRTILDAYEAAYIYEAIGEGDGQ